MIFSRKKTKLSTNTLKNKLQNYVHDTNSTLAILDLTFASIAKYLATIEDEKSAKKLTDLNLARNELAKLSIRLNNLPTEIINSLEEG